jgi:large subunit ribosomal protein L11
MLKKSAGLEKGSENPRQNKVGSVTLTQIREIAKTKIADLNAADESAAIEIIKGTARSMGITVEEG